MVKKERFQLAVEDAMMEDEHFHQDIELFYVLEGEADVNVEKKISHLRQDDIYIVNANRRHSFSAMKGGFLILRLLISYQLVAEGTPNGEAIFWCDSSVAENDIYAEAVKTEGNSITCKIVCGNRQIPVRIPTFGHHHVYAALAAAAVGLQFDLTDEEIAEGISGFQNVGRRGELFQTPFVTLIDDSYNANPDSVKSGIDSLMQQAGRRHICILGDMLELGGSSGVMHEEVGRYAREKGADLVLCSGTFAEYTARGAEECGQSFESREALIHSIPSLLREGDCVLVKASKSSHYETVAQAVRELAKQKETFCGVTSGENPDEC